LEVVVAWVILLISGVFESVWAVALSKSEGFTRPLPVAIFLIGALFSTGGLGIALRDLPVGTGYAVWVGVGATLTVVYALVTGEESVSPIRVALLVGITSCVVGLQLVSGSH
jgi:quaternary ammonium compound-resistance protein SugE